MQTKTYFASSVPAALEVARQELGADALLVNSKPAPAAARNFGRLEVTFAYEAAAKQLAPRQLGAPSMPIAATAVPSEAPTELDEIRRQISALRMAVGRTGVAPADDHGYATKMLCDGGLDADLAREIAAAAARRPGDRQSAVVQELAGRIAYVPFAEMKAGECRALALIGPAGRGKSTTLIKIAVQYGLARRIPVRIYSAGAHGVGGQEQMARYAAIIGVPFQTCESLENLNIAFNDGWKGLALIDTPGLSPADTVEMAEFERFFERRPEIEKHLVLRADSQSADMSHVVSRFAGMKPTRLLFTGADEALSLGAMATALIRSGLPGVFAGTGPQIPDDLEELNRIKLAESIRGEHALAAVAA